MSQRFLLPYALAGLVFLTVLIFSSHSLNDVDCDLSWRLWVFCQLLNNFRKVSVVSRRKKAYLLLHNFYDLQDAILNNI